MMSPDEMRMIRTLIDQETNRIADNVEAMSTLMVEAYRGGAILGEDLRHILHELAQAIRKSP